jgi:ribosomal-protein-alanine N-acetyltransferase
MTPRDLEQVLEIERVSFPTRWRLSAYLNELANPHGVYIVAREDRCVLGFAGMQVVLDEGHIGTLAVAPARRRQRIGTRLLLALIREAQRRRATRLTLEVREGNRAALDLYERFGFRAVALRPGYYQDTNEDAVVMWFNGIDLPFVEGHLREIEATLEAEER